jgi:hypothetical protein
VKETKQCERQSLKLSLVLVLRRLLAAPLMRSEPLSSRKVLLFPSTLVSFKSSSRIFDIAFKSSQRRAGVSFNTHPESLENPRQSIASSLAPLAA